MDKIKELERKSRARNTAWTVAVFAVLILWAIIVLFPFYWMLLTSVKSYASYNAEYVPKFFTLSPTIENYIQAFTAVPLAKYFVNTIIFSFEFQSAESESRRDDDHQHQSCCNKGKDDRIDEISG